MNKKILILYTSVGLGHKYIAQNIGYHLERDGFEVKLYDVLKLQEGPLVKLSEKLHGFINQRMPFIWKWLYTNKTFSDLTLPLRVPLAGRNNFHVKQVIDEFKPDAVLATQTSASAIIAYLKRHGIYQGKFIIAFSDFHLHRYWLYDEADFYIANISEQKDEMVKLGVPAEKIAVCGITLKPQQEVDAQAVKAKLGIKEGEMVIVLASGSLGIGFTPQKIKEFAQGLVVQIPQAKLVVPCGKNLVFKQELEKLQLPQIIPLGFYEPFADIYAITDVFLTKPGGLTTAELLQAGIKPIVTHWLPGQEEINYHYLVGHGLISEMPKSDTAEAWASKVREVLSETAHGETPNSFVITQKNHEGELLLQAVKSVFHNVWRLHSNGLVWDKRH